MTAPDFIWAEMEPYDFPGYSPCWVWHSGDGLVTSDQPLEGYVRRDPAVLASLPEVQALIAAAVMEAAERAGSVVWSGGIPYDEADNALLDASVAVEETIRSLITPDAMAALEAYRDREVAKALERAVARVRATSVPAEWTHEGALQRGALEYAANVLSALIPEVKP